MRIYVPKHTIKALLRRDLSASIRSGGLYVTVTISLFISSFLLKNYLSQVNDHGVVIASDPLNFPLYISLVISSFYLAIISAMSISTEKDQGTLEVLFYGPVNGTSYLISKYIADMIIFLFLIGFLILYLIFVSLLTNLSLSFNLVKGIILSIFSASCIISFSLFISTLTSKRKYSLIWLFSVLSAFLSLQVINATLLRLNEATLSLYLNYLKMALGLINKGIKWVTPFTSLNEGIEAVLIGDPWLYLAKIFFALLYSLFFIILSIAVLERKSVRA